MSHLSASIKAKHARLEVESVPTPTAGPGEILIKVQCITFSPIEFKQQVMEIHPFPYPNNLGMSSGGIVEQVGEGVTGFAPGDRVATARPHSKLEDPRFGSFQQYQLAQPACTSKLPPTVSLEAGASIVLNLSTVFSALTFHLGLDRPSLIGTPATQREGKVLIYGGSSSSGALAVRMARAAGYHVVTTSSPRNHGFVSSLGPDAIIDHTEAHEDVLASIKKHGPYSAICDTVGIPSVTHILTEYLSSIGGGRYNALIPDIGNNKPIPDNVERSFASYGWDIDNNAEAREWFYSQLLPKGLESGTLIPVPLQLVQGGLQSVQHALDLMRDGKVSCAKLVLDPWQKA